MTMTERVGIGERRQCTWHDGDIKMMFDKNEVRWNIQLDKGWAEYNDLIPAAVYEIWSKQL